MNNPRKATFLRKSDRNRKERKDRPVQVAPVFIAPAPLKANATSINPQKKHQ